MYHLNRVDSNNVDWLDEFTCHDVEGSIGTHRVRYRYMLSGT